ncbi:MFS transporter [Actinoplanes sp. RD1]|uniref:MFS transporter n=1 Tax=Actinoplanes sp. RD1 TaxID=3064538 RepID=UPI0027407E33|nr:MFS transporter [Actinoplanes sp. RD1]
MVPLVVGSALNPINSSIIATALVPIAARFGVPAGRTAVLVAVLYVASATAQPALGKVAGRFGPRRVFLAGIVLVFAGGLIGSFAQSLALLTVARVIIGVGTSAGYPTAMLLIRRRAERAGIAAPGSVLGAISIAGQVTVALGLPLGGLLVGAFGWRIVFLVNIPVALLAFATARRWVPGDDPIGTVRTWARDIDLVGVLLFAATFSCLLGFLLSLHDPSWPVLAAAVVLLVTLAGWELRASSPLVDLRLLRSNGALTRTYVRQLCTQLVMYSLMYGVTQWVQDGKGLSAAATGLVMLPMTGMSALVTAPVARRNAVRVPLLIAAAVALGVAVTLRFMSVSTPTAAIIAVTVAFGVTVSLGAVGNQGALYAQSPAHDAGTAAGLMRTASYLGAILASSLISLSYAHGVTDAGLHSIATVLVAGSTVLLLITALDRRLPTHIDRP